MNDKLSVMVGIISIIFFIVFVLIGNACIEKDNK